MNTKTITAICETIHWIAVEQDLPDDMATVLIYAPNVSEPVFLGYLDGGHWRDTEATPVFGIVTHWAHLPAGPWQISGRASA